MADIEMLGGSDFHLNHGKEDGAAQTGSGSGEIEMLGGSDLHLNHNPLPSEQKGGSAKPDMIGLQNLIREHGVSPYGANKPTDHGTE